MNSKICLLKAETCEKKKGNEMQNARRRIIPIQMLTIFFNISNVNALKKDNVLKKKKEGKNAMCVNISLIYLLINFTGVRVLNARKFPTLHIFPSYIENQNQQKGQLIVDM